MTDSILHRLDGLKTHPAVRRFRRRARALRTHLPALQARGLAPHLPVRLAQRMRSVKQRRLVALLLLLPVALLLLRCALPDTSVEAGWYEAMAAVDSREITPDTVACLHSLIDLESDGGMFIWHSVKEDRLREVFEAQRVAFDEHDFTEQSSFCFDD